MAMKEAKRYVILIVEQGQWMVDDETDDTTLAIFAVRGYHDRGVTARLFDTQEEF